MARKRKRARSNAAPLFVLFSLALLAAVGFAIAPRGRHAGAVSRHRTPAIARALPSPVPELATASPTTAQTASGVPASPAPANATPQAHASGVQVAVIIDDCGQWIGTERAYLALPIPLTLSVLPYVHYTSEISREALDAGKGVMLHLPMEPLAHIDPGPGEIKTDMTDEAIARQTEDDVAQVPLARGVNNHEGSAASADPRVMKDVIGVVKAHDLFFIDSRTNARTVAARQAQEAGVPSASRDVFLDDRAQVDYTEAMLERAVAIARRNGAAIAIGHPKPTTLEALREMYPKMESEGVRFVLAQDVVH